MLKEKLDELGLEYEEIITNWGREYYLAKHRLLIAVYHSKKWTVTKTPKYGNYGLCGDGDLDVLFAYLERLSR